MGVTYYYTVGVKTKLLFLYTYFFKCIVLTFSIYIVLAAEDEAACNVVHAPPRPRPYRIIRYTHITRRYYNNKIMMTYTVIHFFTVNRNLYSFNSFHDSC